MNPVDTRDLRDALAERADSVRDAPQARIGAVHQRVARIRRRRRAAIAAASVTAVVAVLAVVPLTDRDGVSPADRGAPTRLAGREVPRTQTATGFTYRYVRGYQSAAGDRSLEVDVRVGSTPRLVMWASSDTDPDPVVEVTDRAGGDPPETSGAGGFSRYAYLPSDPEGDRTARIRVSQRDAGQGTRLAVAVYDLSRTPPPGVSNGTVTFRSLAQGESLVGGVIGTRGQTDVTLSVQVPAAGLLSFAGTCYGTAKWYSLQVDGREALGGDCARAPDLDPGAGLAPLADDLLPAGVRAGDTVQLRLHLSPDSDHAGEVARDPSAVLGIGVYTRLAPVHPVAGQDVRDLVETRGHDWRAHEWLASDPGAKSLTVPMTASVRPRLLRWYASGLAVDTTSRLALRVASSGAAEGQVLDQENRSGSLLMTGSGYVVQPGQTPRVTLEVPEGSTPATRLALVISDQQP